jgi:hypothetical protein
MGLYTVAQRHRIWLKARIMLGLVRKDDSEDYLDFMDECTSDMEEIGVEDPEAACQIIWDEQGGY